MSDWVVIMECRVRKEVILRDCTEEQAKLNPWDYAEDETEIDQIDWKVLKVMENK